MQRNKSIKKILQTTAIIGTILPLNLLWLTSQIVYTEKDATAFNLDNFDVSARKLSPVGTKFSLTDVIEIEQQKWCSSLEGPQLQFEVISETTSGTSHGSVKIIRNSDTSLKTIIHNLSIQPFITIKSDGLVYDVREIDDYAFSDDQTLGNPGTKLVFEDQKIDTVRIPSGITRIGDYPFQTDDISGFPSAGKFAFSFYNSATTAFKSGELFGNLERSLLNETQFSDLFLTNSSIKDNLCINKPIIAQSKGSPRRLDTVHLNGFSTINFDGTPRDKTDPFRSIPLKEVSLYNNGDSAYYLPPAYPSNPVYLFDSEAKATSTQTRWSSQGFPDTQCAAGPHRLNAVIAELPSDLGVTYDASIFPQKKSLKFSAYSEGDITASEQGLSAKFYFNMETEENPNFSLDKVESGLNNYEEYYKKNYQITVKDSFDPFKKIFNGIYPCRMVLSSSFDSSTNQEYSFSLEIKNNPAPDITGIELSQNTISAKLGDTAITLKASILPKGAISGVSWSSTNPLVATVDSNGVVEFRSKGTTDIIATSTVVSSIRDICNVIVDYKNPESISLSRDTISTKINSDPSQLTYTILPSPEANQEAIITSDDEKIASVAHTGNTITVTPHSFGSTKIWIASKDLPAIKKSCAIDVQYSDPTEIILSDSEIVGSIGKNRQITASVIPITADQEAVEWSSDNEGIAQVDSGTGFLIFKAIGKCTITATSKNFPAIKKNCSVTVNNSTPKNIKLSTQSYSGKIHDKLKITAQVQPSDADQAVQWGSSNTSIATVDNFGEVILVSHGTCSIIVSSKADPKITATCAITVINDKSDSMGMIIGIAAGSTVGVAAIATGTTVYVKKHNKLKKPKK